MTSDAMTETQAMELFARFYLKTPNDPFQAATSLFPDNTENALWVATNWANEPKVLAMMDKITESEGEEKFLPTKADLARGVWDRMKGACDDESYAKLGKLFADVCGYIKKPEPTQVNVNNTTNKVLVVPASRSDDDWETRLAEQQRNLIGG